ncbi:MAG TPA: NAD(P)H-hydrate epimerase [Planctomycetota bacterium]|nr:NAD(P)H-hydrate epimerase [Planctomycetota bacterium]
MRWVTRDEMRGIDRRAIEELGIPALVLMENAGRGAAGEAAKLYREKGLGGPVLVFCGAGNNGGDGFVVARHLANAGLDVRVLCCFDRGKADRLREAGVNLTICERMGLPISDVLHAEGVERLRAQLVPGALVVDAVFGVGLSQPPREPQATLLRLLNEAGLATLAVDVPSGLDADTGVALGVALRADVTATMACPKVGFRRPGAAQYVGRLVVVDIGMPACLGQ